jgi:prepilin-type N-terminal cleavage/methylation domain-containing protein
MPSRSRGFTLVEVVIALAVLAFAFFGMISVITYTTRMNLASQQRTLATRAAERKIEQMLNMADYSRIYEQFSKNGPGDQGYGWDIVEGLESYALNQPEELTMATGYVYPVLSPALKANLFVRFPLNAGGNGFNEVGSGKFMGNVIYQNPDDPASLILGYRDVDLNGNGSTTDPAVQAADLKVLPVIVEVHWKGAVGPGSGTAGHPYVSYKYTFFNKKALTP